MAYDVDLIYIMSRVCLQYLLVLLCIFV